MYSLIKNLSHAVLVEHLWLLGNSIFSKRAESSIHWRISFSRELP